MLYYYIRSFAYKKKYKDCWLFCERGIDAKDNAYWMFKYVIEKHPNVKAYYIIDYNSKDYEKVKSIGPTIEYKSIEHKVALFNAKKLISSHTGFINIWSYKLYKILFDRKNKQKYIFLQHGITQNNLSKIFNKSIDCIDCVITATNDEYRSIKETKDYGFKDEVVLTGFARFDQLKNCKTKNQILLMPSWRNYILTPSYKKQNNKDIDKFIASNYFKTYNSLLNNKKLHKILEVNNIKLIFQLHPEVIKFISMFNVKNENIIISDISADTQTLLKESKLLITDYSSVFFDFAYMKKPIIYYQFDEKEFYSKHYEKGYFNHEKHGFGKVIYEEDILIDEIERIIENKYIIDDMYKSRIDNTFKFTDTNNCNRIFDEINKIN